LILSLKKWKLEIAESESGEYFQAVGDGENWFSVENLSQDFIGKMIELHDMAVADAYKQGLYDGVEVKRESEEE
jgi:hypothetical protein